MDDVASLSLEEVKEGKPEEEKGSEKDTTERKKFADRILDFSPIEGLRFVFCLFVWYFLIFNIIIVDCRLLILPTQIKDVVSIRGSILGGDYFSGPNHKV